MQKSVKVSIAYCLECGYQQPAFELAKSLIDQFQLMLSAVELVPWTNGSFDVRVDGDLVHSMYRDGGFPTGEAIAEAVQTRIAGG